MSESINWDATWESEEIAERFLMRDGNLRVPCGRYGSDTESCVPYALAVERIVREDTGEPSTLRSLEHTMGLVVNSHDDIANLISEHGTPLERALLGSS